MEGKRVITGNEMEGSENLGKGREGGGRKKKVSRNNGHE